MYIFSGPGAQHLIWLQHDFSQPQAKWTPIREHKPLFKGSHYLRYYLIQWQRKQWIGLIFENTHKRKQKVYSHETWHIKGNFITTKVLQLFLRAVKPQQECLVLPAFSPGWCGSMDWVPACKLKGHWFDFQSGHMPGLQARSPLGGMHEQLLGIAFAHLGFSLSLPSLPLSLKINKI